MRPVDNERTPAAIAEPDAPGESDALTEVDARARVEGFPPRDQSAPDWIPDAVLRAWATLPPALTFFRDGLDRAKGAERLALIRAGVNRRHKGSVGRGSAVAGNLARLCRDHPLFWRGTANGAIGLHCDAISDADLLRLAADPLAFYDKTDVAPEIVLLFALALDADQQALEVIAGDCESLVADPKPADPVEVERERVGVLEAEAAELRRTAKEADKATRAAEKRAAGLAAELERLRAAGEKGISEVEAEKVRIEQELRARAETAETQLEALRADADRVSELESTVHALEDARDELAVEAAGACEERLLREQAENDAARHIARVRELTERLDSMADSRNLPVDDARGLIGALSRPVGQAARHASDRLASGRMREGDDLMLALAASFSDVARRLDCLDTADDALATVTANPDAPVAEVLAPAVVPVESEADAAPDVQAEPESAIEPEPAPPAATAAGRRRRRPRFTVTPLGGAGEVGGSALLVRNPSGHTVLLDCGQRVKGEYGLDTEATFHRRIGIDADLDAILISHAHIDHVGSLPILHREQSQAQDKPIPIFMTDPTRRLTEIMLNDSAKIQQYKETDPSERGFTDYALGSMEAAYRLSDVRQVMSDEIIRVVEPARVVPIPDTSLVARFLPVAHVLGSCAIHLTDMEHDQTLLYTGDLGPFTEPQITVPHYPLAEMLPADIVVMESTYGRPPEMDRAAAAEGRRRRGLFGRERAIKLLYEASTHAFDHGGSVLLPAFSLGRTQEIAKIIQRGRQDGDLPPSGRIYIAGMGEKIVEVYSDFGSTSWGRAEDLPRTEELGKLVRGGRSFEEAAVEVLDGESSFIIASPAMLTSGWSRVFLKEMVDDARHAIVLSGYMPRNAGGIPNLHRLAHGNDIEIDGLRQKINARWEKAGLSAHAPAQDLRDFARHMARQADHVSFGLVHGDPAGQKALEEDIPAQNDNATAESLSNNQVWRPSPGA